MATLSQEATEKTPALQSAIIPGPGLLTLAVGALSLAIPTMIFVIRESWSGEPGAHGPIVLFTGLWLLWREWGTARAHSSQPPLWRVILLLCVTIPLYIFSRITQI